MRYCEHRVCILNLWSKLCEMLAWWPDQESVWLHLCCTLCSLVYNHCLYTDGWKRAHTQITAPNRLRKLSSCASRVTIRSITRSNACLSLDVYFNVSSVRRENVATKASQGEEIDASEDALVENPHTLDDLQLGEIHECIFSLELQLTNNQRKLQCRWIRT